MEKHSGRGGRGHAWIKEGEEDEPLDFLDTGAVKRVLGVYMGCWVCAWGTGCVRGVLGVCGVLVFWFNIRFFYSSRDAGTNPDSVKQRQRKRTASDFQTADDGRLIVDNDHGEGTNTHPHTGETGLTVNMHVTIQ